MTKESIATLPMWMLVSAAFGFIIGEACGDNRRHRVWRSNGDSKSHLAL